MPLNLLALCGSPGDPSVKRVRTSADVQNRLDGWFDLLESQFRHGIEIEREYDSRWTPGSEELATLPEGPEVAQILARLQGGVLALPEISGPNFDNEQIRALAVHRENAGAARVLLQTFTSAQRLGRKFAVVSNGNTFDRIDRSAFNLTNQIDVIIENGLVKFKNFFNAKKILDISEHYRLATDIEITELSQHGIIQAESAALISIVSDPIRKLVSSVRASGVLDRETAHTIRAKSNGLLEVTVENDKIVLPMNRRELKDLMSFLDHKIYRSPVDEDAYETNSHRRRQT